MGTLEQSWRLYWEGRGPKPKKPPPLRERPEGEKPPPDPEFERAKKSLTEGYPEGSGLKTISPAGQGMIQEEIREPTWKESIRHTVSDIPLPWRLGVEAGPSMGGAGLGLKAASALSLLPSPWTKIPRALRYLMAGAGALGGEEVAQETGVSPESVISKGAAAVLPPVAAAPARATARSARGFAKGFPGAPKAVERVVSEEAEEAIPRMRSALGQKPRSKYYYGQVEKTRVPLGKEDLPGVRKGIQSLRQEIERTGATELPEGRQIGKVLDNAEAALSSGEFDMEGLVRLAQYVGQANRRWRKSGGQKLGAVKKLYRDIHENLKDLTKGPRTKESAEAARNAIAAARREFAVNGLFDDFAKAFRVEGGEGDRVLFDARTALQKFKNSTNPDHPQYNRNLVESLEKDELKDIKQFLTWTNKHIGKKGMIGNIVVRGRGAKGGEEAMKGAFLLGTGGFFAGGPLAAGLGALIGARLPEWVAGGLLTKQGRKIIKRAIDQDPKPGVVSDTISQLAQIGRAAAFTEDPEGELEPMKRSIREQTIGGLQRIGVDPKTSTDLVHDFETYVEEQSARSR